MLERLILSALSAIVLFGMNTPSVSAEVTAANQSMHTNKMTNIQPIPLVQLAYQGYFQDQGIPSNGAFISAVQSGRVDAKELIESAVERGRLSTDTLNNQGYLNIVNVALQDLIDE